MTSAIRSGETEVLRRQKWIDQLSQDHCLHSIICQCLKDKPEARPTTLKLNNKMKTLCVQNPRSLADIISVWDNSEVSYMMDYGGK